jgi:hypothetical protein
METTPLQIEIKNIEDGSSLAILNPTALIPLG